MTEPGTKAFPGGRTRAVTIVGLGVMGGSVAKALARSVPGLPIFGVEPDGESAESAARDGVRVVPTADECPLEGGVVVLAGPMDTTVALVRDTEPSWRGPVRRCGHRSLGLPARMTRGRYAPSKLASRRSGACWKRETSKASRIS